MTIVTTTVQLTMKHKYHFLPATGVPDDSNAQGPPRVRSQLRVLAGILAGVN